eukprot:GHVR01149828.1.p1 GENE.GHVR01149828.1~~GHVR01149828.1.p1  ORF type:complete len:280 (+),score=28.15 GHVR01149828.1:32-871(+)
MDSLGDDLTMRLNPDVYDINRIPSSFWPLAKLSVTAKFLLGYLLLITIAPTLVSKLSKPPPVVPKDASVMERFSKDPLIALQAIYNLAQVVMCSWMVFRGLFLVRELNLGFFGNSYEVERVELASLTWYFFISKAVDFIDTIFIIVRHKWRQLSFLHTYHHFSTFILFWVANRTGYDGDIWFSVVVNSFVHVVMYGYYLACSFNIQIPRVLKMAITNLQRVQFVLMVSQSVLMLWYKAAFPHRVTYLYLSYVTSLLFLFTQFFRREYGGETNMKTDKIN